MKTKKKAKNNFSRADFFRTLWQYCEGGDADLRAFPSKRTELVPSDKPEAVDKFCADNDADNLFFGVALRRGGRTKKHITEIPAVWCDVDYKDTPRKAFIEKSKHFPFKPSVMVFSGGGVHLYWILQEPVTQVEIGQVELINRKIASALGGDMNATDASRILRIPDTVNRKPERNNALCKVERIDNFAYFLDDFDDLAEPDTVKTVSDKDTDYDPAKKNRRAEQIMQCAFMAHCQADAATLPKIQWYAMISQLVREKGGVRLIHELSRPYPAYSAQETDSKILHALNDTGPLTCKRIRDLWDCGKDCGVKSPAALAHKKEADDNIREQIQKLNEKYAVVMLGGKCLVMQETVNPILGTPDVVFSALKDFKNFHANCFVRGPDNKKISLPGLWIQSEERRQYRDIVCEPNGTPDGCYNLWRGLAVEPVQGEWSAFKNHIFEVICDEDRDLFRWVLAWIADLFQNPGGERPGTAIVLRGGQGTGKGTFVEQIGKILGKHYLPVASQSQVTGRFNNHLKDTFLLFCDEALWGGDRSKAGVLKNLITEPIIMIEAKNKDAFPLKNRVRMIMASNEDWVVPAGIDERRFAVMDVSDRYKKNYPYIEKIKDEMKNGGREAMLYDLLNLDISDVNLREIPKTKALLEQKINSMNTVQKYWYDPLADGEGDTIWENWVKSDELYQNYLMFCDNIGQKKYRVLKPMFVKEMKKLCPKMTLSRPRAENQVRGYNFPSLEHCREMFEKFINMPLDWYEPEDKIL
ncbi:DUF5906 domain-containing protein [Desulfonema magnum]|nr:DUF5906 domain-containing protein [Desulfonema magnum]